MDSFDEVVKRNGFDIKEARILFLQVCKDMDKKPEEIINKGINLIVKSVGVLYRTNWDCVGEKIAHVNATETDDTVIFLMTIGLMLAWEKVEKEGITSNISYSDLKIWMN